jgi:two-component system sensor histidine kinase AgrC
LQHLPWILLITGFATGFLATWMGLLLVNIRPSLFKLVMVASFYSLVNVIARSFPIPFGGHFIILLAALYIMIMMGWRLGLFKALIPTIIGMLVLILSESLCVSIVIRVSNLTISDIMQEFIFWSFVPQIMLILAVIKIIDRFNLHIFDFNNYDLDNFSNAIRYNSVSILTGLALLLLMLQIMLNLSIVYACPSHFFKSISLEDAGVLSTILMITIFVTMALIINQLLVMSRKENEYLVQLAYLNTVDELFTAIRAEGHDRINHLQTLYGFVQLGNLNETRKYLEELMGDIVISQHYAVQGNPGLSALFYIKSGIATSQGIQLSFKIESDVSHIAVPSYELNRIVGNLINNAFDAIADLERENQWVSVNICEQESNYIFKISNYGNINPQIAQNIFSRGYTTKQGSHSGMGLFIIAQLVQKYGGKIMLESKENMVEFAVALPKAKPRREIDALSGSKDSPKTDREFKASG